MSQANDFAFLKNIAKAFFDDGDGDNPKSRAQSTAPKQDLTGPTINNTDKKKASAVKDNHLNSLGDDDQKPRDAKFQALIKEVYEEFADKERQFFLNLFTSKLRKLCNGALHIDYALKCPGEECLKPVIDKFQLSDFGFTLQQISHPMPTTIHSGFKDGWIFADIRSPTGTDVKQLFLGPAARKTDEVKIGKALGYPVEFGNRTVSYINATEHGILEQITGKEVCCVPGFEYTCKVTCKVGTEKDWRLINAHFLKSVKAAEEIGVRLTLDIHEFPELEEWYEKQWST